MKFDVLRTGASLAAATSTVLASTACGTGGHTYPTPKAVHHSELVGRWDGAGDCSPLLPVVRLRDDYTFSAKDVPVEWDGPGPDSKVTRLSTGGKWHAVNKDPGLTPYLVLGFDDRKRIEFMPFFLEQGKLRVSGDVEVSDGDPYYYDCDYKRISADPEFGR